MKTTHTVKIIPEPVSITETSGNFTLTENTIINVNPVLRNIGEFLILLLLPATGFKLKIKDITQQAQNNNSISLKLIEDNTKLGTEGYILEINPEEVIISGTTPTGVFYGTQTLRQILPPEIEINHYLENLNWEIPCLKIIDYPRFSWRGYMLDDARHFHGKEVVKRLFNLMALLKLNIFHWHLTDDQGWRIEIKKYPRLIEVGSKREETQVGGFLSKKTDGIPHSGYYSQEDIQEIVDYAKERFITIIPEIDIPGHTRALLASFPDLSCKGYPFKVSSHWGIHKDVLCVGKESVFEFIQDILNEIMDLFPSDIIHIGGDEVRKIRWRECPDCQKRLKEEGFENEKDLQIYFTNRISSYLASHGHRSIGWNDVLDDNLKENIICQYWLRGKNKVYEHIKKGRDTIMSNFKFTYLDHSYSFTPLKLAYKFEPIPKNLEKEYHHQILGIEALIWSEFIPNLKRLEWQTFPRLIAFAEAGWTPKNNRNFHSFRSRLIFFLKRMDTIGINYAHMNEVKPHFLKRLFGVFTLLKEGKGGE